MIGATYAGGAAAAAATGHWAAASPSSLSRARFFFTYTAAAPQPTRSSASTAISVPVCPRAPVMAADTHWLSMHACAAAQSCPAQRAGGALTSFDSSGFSPHFGLLQRTLIFSPAGFDDSR